MTKELERQFIEEWKEQYTEYSRKVDNSPLAKFKNQLIAQKLSDFIDISHFSKEGQKQIKDIEENWRDL